MGTPSFAVPSLDAVAAAHTTVGVFSRPDARSSRGGRLLPPPVKTRAAELGIPVFQPSSLRDPAVVQTIADLAADVICVAAYGMLLPPELLVLPRFGCVNVHASLLPRYRGAAPVERAILNGDDTTGVSIMRMEEGLDTGPYALQVTVRIENLDATALTARLADVGAAALVEVLARLNSGDVRWTAQDDGGATCAPKLTRADVAVTPELSATEALRRIRASSKRATVRVSVDGVDMVVLSASLHDAYLPQAAASCTKTGLLLGFATGTLLADRVRPAGRGAMTGAAWACGFRGDAGATWRSA